MLDFVSVEKARAETSEMSRSPSLPRKGCARRSGGKTHVDLAAVSELEMNHLLC